MSRWRRLAAAAGLAGAMLAGSAPAQAQAVTVSAGAGLSSSTGYLRSTPWVAVTNRNFIRLERLSADARLRLDLDGPALSAALLPTLPYPLPAPWDDRVGVAYLGPELSYSFMTLSSESSHWSAGVVAGTRLPLDPQLQLQLEVGWNGKNWQARVGGIFNF